MRWTKRRTALAALLLAAAVAGCDGDGASGDPLAPDPPAGPPDLGRSGSIEGTHRYDRIEIPVGVTITVTGPLVLNATEDVVIAGTLAGDCVPITINGNATLDVRGTVRNACTTLPEDADPPALTLVASGEVTFDGALVETSGNLEMRNDPSLREADFPEPAAAAADPAGAGPAHGPDPAGAGGPPPPSGTTSASALVEAAPRDAGPPAVAAAIGLVILRNSRFVARPERARDGRDGQNGTNGRDGRAWRLLVRGDLLMAGNNLVQGQSGGHGGHGTHTGAPATSRGGNGGTGGRISVLATGTLTFSAPGSNRVVSGSGGDGGNSTSTALPGDGPRAPGATARAGDGGAPGLVRLEGQAGVRADGSLVVEIGAPDRRGGGHGGMATATAADGSICVDGRGQAGGHASATAGSGGGSPNRKLVEGGNATLSAPPNVTGGHGGHGGKAVATAGNGLPGQDCETCLHGGDGGDFDAQGGDGGDARIRDIDGDLVGAGGDGGASEHRGGNGGDGSDCCEPAPGPGGDGGAGGTAAGGDGKPGTGRDDGGAGGVTIASGNAGRGGKGAPAGKGSKGGNDETRAIGTKNVDGDHFRDGPDGTSCTAPPVAAIDGTYAVTGRRIHHDGPCPPGDEAIAAAALPIKADGDGLVVHSLVPVAGTYDATTGEFSGSATSDPDPNTGARIREGFELTFQIGSITFAGFRTLELIHPAGSVICTFVYEIEGKRNE